MSATQINLSWTDKSTNETGFKIESSAGTLINTTATNVTRYSHTGLTCNTTHAYYLIATNAFGDSATIKTSATTASCTLPPPPPPITATNLTPYQDTGLGVRVTLEGSGQGRVVSTTKGVNDQGIDCSATDQLTGCQANFAPATYVTLTPIPAEHSAFSGWGGHPECQKGTFLMTSGILCTAYFRTLIHPLTLTLNGRGKVTGQGLTCTATSCKGNYLEGTPVTLQVSHPRLSWTFAGWSGDCDSQGTVALTAAKTCQANFVDDPNIPNDRDGNGDGLTDAYQDNVVSIPDKHTSQYVTAEVEKDCTIDSMSTEMLDQVAAADPSYQFHQGLLYFDILCIKTKVTFYYHGISKITRRLVRQKYGPKIPGDFSTLGWYIIPEVVFDTVKVGKQTVVQASYFLIDSEFGDNTGVDGHILDPVGVGWEK